MSFRNAYGIYQVLEQLLKETDRPLTCVDLFDSPEVKKFVEDANRVSDYLGHMYRRGLLSRYAAPKDDRSMARYAYSWKNPKLGAPIQRNVQPRLNVVTIAERPPAPPRANSSAAAKPHFAVTEEAGAVTIELAEFLLTIKIKS